MTPKEIIQELARNKGVLEYQLKYVTIDKSVWRPHKDHWCLLEVVSHLHDEEREDFRARVKHVLESPDLPPPPIHPAQWVTSRDYINQDYSTKVEQFLYQRQVSLDWLDTLRDAPWDQAYQHPKYGPMTARMFLTNWLAHDYIHIRQINRIHFKYAEEHNEESIDYAGNWL